MTGKLLVFKKGLNEIPKHTHLILKTSTCNVIYNDVRRFGYFDIANNNALDKVSYLSSLGPDPLKISKKEFADLVMSKKRMIKSLLLDQKTISGLGNIYTDEILFLSRINPKKLSSKINSEKIEILYDSMISILKKAISHRGSSIQDYLDGLGVKGKFQNLHKVYQREGEPCYNCGEKIKRIKISSRSTYYCEKCQK